jgi:hypothetical protein
MSEDKLRNMLADRAHSVWAGWMDYMFSMGNFTEEGDFVIPSRFVNRWKRQAKATYTELSESERKSDLEIADQYQEVLETYALENKVIVLPFAQYEKAIRDAKEKALDPVRADLLTTLTNARSAAIGKDNKMVIACNDLLQRLGLTGK